MNTETSNDVTIKDVTIKTIYHSDHSMDSRSLTWCLSQVKTMGTMGFFLKTFTIPSDHSDAVNALYGPVAAMSSLLALFFEEKEEIFDDKMIDLADQADL